MNSNYNIFYADDDQDDLDMFQSATEKLGVNVSLFTGGNELMAALEQQAHPSIIFLDLNMPRKDGFDILTEIREIEALKEIPVVIYTTTKNPVMIEKAWNLGADYYVCKSCTFPQIVDSIRASTSMDWKNFKRAKSEFIYSAPEED